MGGHLDKLLLALLDALPDRLARHLLFLLRAHPRIPDRWGYHLRPIHFYEPLPDFRTIDPGQCLARRPRAGIDFHLTEQVSLCERLGARYRRELQILAEENTPGAFDFANAYFSGLDACLYYALIRDLRPARIVEVGAGFSTRIACRALGVNRAEGSPGQLTAVEPYPGPRLDPVLEDITLIENPVEALEPALFAALGENDILFIDSSHAACFGSDVTRLLLEILPVIGSGVWIQVHDIFFPRDYPPEWLLQRRLAFNEQYLLEAFLNFNQEFRICAACHWLWLDHAEAVAALCPPPITAAAAGGNASLWLRRQ